MNYSKYKNNFNRLFFDEGVLHFIRRKIFPNSISFKGEHVKKITFRNKKIQIVLDSENGFVDSHIFFCGTWEREILSFVTKYLEDKMVVLDIGANIGQHSLIFSRFSKKVIAFEPIPKLCEQFEKSIKLNCFKNIEVHNCAIGETKGIKKIFLEHNHMGGSSMKIEHNRIGSIEIIVQALDDLVQERVDFVKVDTEGYEPNVILGNKNFFLRNQPIIWLEFTPKSYDLDGDFSTENLLYFFIEQGYKIYSFKQSKYLENFYNLDMESQDDWIAFPKGKF